MIQEILLSLSGHPSPLLRQAHQSQDTFDDDLYSPAISPPEQALLATLAHIGELHQKLKKQAQDISFSHPSTICRTVGSTISAQQLREFQLRILEVEKAIVSKDARYVGGYGIVPLSTLVNEFTPWTRRLDWLSELTRFILPASSYERIKSETVCTGAAIINFLRNEMHTGYADIEEMSISLLKVAERAWMKQLSTWVLYGKLPTMGPEDFFIQEGGSSQPKPLVLPEFIVHPDLMPGFVTPSVAASILLIGKSLSQLRCPSTTGLVPTPSTSRQALALLPVHLEYLKSLSSPISSSHMEGVINSIRHSMSKNALAQLLPLQQVVELLRVLHEFLLLGRGEFAVSLISNADMRIQRHNHAQELSNPIRKAGRVDAVLLKEGELAALLKQTWSELTSFQNDTDTADETLEFAGTLLRLVTVQADNNQSETNSPGAEFSSLVFPVPTLLTISLPASSPLNLLLTSADLSIYSSINAFLLSIRKAQLHLASIWKLTSLRRSQPSPIGPPLSCTRDGERKLSNQRRRDNFRARQSRAHWAMASKALFVMSEIGTYFQFEIIGNCWEHFHRWVNGSDIGETSSTSKIHELHAAFSTSSATHFQKPQPSVASGPIRDLHSSQAQDSRSQANPATLSLAHRHYLHALTSALLLRESEFLRTLTVVLTAINHFVALFSRLQSVQQGLDLQEDGGVADTLATYEADEREILAELRRSRETLEALLPELVQCLRDIEESKAEGGSADDLEESLEIAALGCDYVPWKGRTLESLVMKLEFLAGRKEEDGHMDEDTPA